MRYPMEKKNSLLLFNTFNADHTEMDGLADCKCDYAFAVCILINVRFPSATLTMLN